MGIISKIRYKITTLVSRYGYAIFGIKVKLVSGGTRIKSQVLLPARYQEKYFPDVFEISKSSQMLLRFNEERLCEVESASVRFFSDFVMLAKNEAYNEKLFNQDYLYFKARDRDLLFQKGGYVYLKKPRKIIDLDNVFTINSVYMWHFGHFLIESLTKLRLLNKISTKINLTIPLPVNLDENCRELVAIGVSQYKNVKIEYLPENATVRARNLYIPLMSDFVPNDGPASPGGLRLCHESYHYLVSIFNSVYKRYPSALHAEGVQRLFIEHFGRNRPENYDEVRNFFIAKGFSAVHTANMTLEAKANLFQGVRFLACAATSANLNIFLARRVCKILVVSGFVRAYDSLLSTYARLYGHRLLIVGCKQSLFTSLDSSYIVNIEILQRAYEVMCAESH